MADILKDSPFFNDENILTDRKLMDKNDQENIDFAPKKVVKPKSKRKKQGENLKQVV